MSYHPRSLGFFDVQAEIDQYARQAASYVGQYAEDEIVRRMPGILNKIQPDLNNSATKAMKSAMQDEAFKSAISSTEGKIATYAIVGGVAVVCATSLFTWWLVKG